MKTIHFIVMVCCFPCLLFATDNSGHAFFYDSLETIFLQQYRECTGNMKDIDNKDLAEWKDKMITLAQSKEYISLLREYKASVDSNRFILPCKVIAWNFERKKNQSQKEDTLIQKLLAREELENAQKEAALILTSKYDIPFVPFGLCKKTFLLLFRHAYSTDLVDMGNYYYVKSFIWGNRPFLTAFYFDRKTGLFCKYEIESASQPSDKLNNIVRVDAEYLSQQFSLIFGDAAKRFSIGFFDIKSGILAPYKTWDTPQGNNVYIGISMNNYRYYAKAIVQVTPVFKADSLATNKP